MKQPLLPVALTYAVGLVLAAAWPLPPWGPLALSLGLALAALCLPRWRPILLWPLLLVTGVASLTARTARLAPHDLRAIAGDSPQIVSVRGRVVGIPSLREPASGQPGQPHTLAVLEVERLTRNRSTQPALGRILVTTRGELDSRFHSAQPVEIEGVLAAPDGPAAPGLFDYRRYLYWQGIYHQLRVRSTGDWRIADADAGPPPLADRFLAWARATLAHGLPQVDAPLRLLWAMTLGWRTALTDDAAEPFMHTGTMHIFAISGLHIALIVGILVALLRVLQLPRPLCGAGVIPVMWFYTLATGWQASAVRSSLMMSVVVLGWSLRRPPELLNSLATSAWLILLWEPRQLFQASFQLSFCVVFSMALLLPVLDRLRTRLLSPDPLLPTELLPRWRRWLDRPARWLTLSLGVALSAWLGSLPLGAHYFHLVTPVSLLVNVLVVPLGSLALMCTLGSLICGPWFPALAVLFNHSAWFWMTLVTRLCDWAGSLPGAWFHAASPGFLGFVAWYGFLVWLSGRFVTGTGWRRLNLSVLALVALAWWVQTRLADRRITLTLLDTGSGGTVWIDRPGTQHDLLVDCGDASRAASIVKPFLQAKGINRIPRVAFTHGDVRHVGGWMVLSHSFRFGEVGLGEVRFRSPAYRALSAQFRERPEHRLLRRGDDWAGWRVLHPDPTDGFTLADDNAVVLRGEIAGTRVLLLSDLASAGQAALVARESELAADVVVTGVPSRGEPLGNALLEAVRPKLVLLDDSSPNTRLAPPDYVRRWRAAGIRVLRTREQGTVTVEFHLDRSDSATQDWQLRSRGG